MLAMERFYPSFQVSYFGADLEAPEKRQENIFIGVSVGAPSAGSFQAKMHLDFALSNTRERILVLIADKIHAVNLQIFQGFSKTAAIDKAIEKGRQWEQSYEKAIKQISHESRVDLNEIINIVRWDDIVSERYKLAREKILNEFSDNRDFRDNVMQFTEKYSRRRNIILSDKKKYLLCNYILEELPTLFWGVDYKDEKYRLLVYPAMSGESMGKFLLDFRTGRYPKLLNIIDSPAAMVELRPNETHNRRLAMGNF